MQASKLQYLTVPVDIPQMEVVHTAYLKLHHGLQKVSPELDYVAVAQPIPAELVIKHTRRWLTEMESQPSNEALDFCYEVQANPDTWLIGGQRKAHFKAQVSSHANHRLAITMLTAIRRTNCKAFRCY